MYFTAPKTGRQHIARARAGKAGEKSERRARLLAGMPVWRDGSFKKYLKGVPL